MLTESTYGMTYSLGPWSAVPAWDGTYSLYHYSHKVGTGFPSITAAFCSGVGPCDTPSGFRRVAGATFVAQPR